MMTSLTESQPAQLPCMYAMATGSDIPEELIKDYKCHCKKSGKALPTTLTTFYRALLAYIISESEAERFNSCKNKSEFTKNGDALDLLGEVAFESFVRQKKITNATLRLNEAQVEALFYGLLVKNTSTKFTKRDSYTFKYKALQEYLAATYQFEQIKKHVSGKAKTLSQKNVPSYLRESVNRLPLTGDIWRMTFGLLTQSEVSMTTQIQLLRCLITESLTLVTMSSFDITSLCVESIYESGNGCDWFKLTPGVTSYAGSLLDCFSLNQTISYSGVSLASHRVAYTLTSLAYFIQVCPDLFALYLSDFDGLDTNSVFYLSENMFATSSHVSNDSNITLKNILTSTEHQNTGLKPSEMNLGIDNCSKIHDLSQGNGHSSQPIDIPPKSVNSPSNISHTKSSIQVLNFSHNQLSCKGLFNLQPMLERLHVLTHLDLGYCCIGDESLAMLSGLFIQMSLLFIRLSHNDISDVGFLCLTKNLRYCRTLEWLDVSANRLTDKAVPSLASALPILKRLRNLDLSENLISDDGIQSLSENLESLMPLSRDQSKELSTNKRGKQRWTTKSMRKVSMHLNRIPAGGVMAKKRNVRSRSIDDQIDEEEEGGD